MGLKPRARRKPAPMCDKPDRDEPKLVCGAPLPCLRHVVMVVIGKEPAMNQWGFQCVAVLLADGPIDSVCRHNGVTGGGMECIECRAGTDYSTPQPGDPYWDLEALIRIIRAISLAYHLRRYAIYYSPGEKQ